MRERLIGGHHADSHIVRMLSIHPLRDVQDGGAGGVRSRWRTWMRQVARRAGLPQPRLVEAPLSVAEQLLTNGVRWQAGSFVAMYDVGAGAEVTILRRGLTGFEVLATLDDMAVRGTAIDRAFAAAIPTGRTCPTVWAIGRCCKRL